MVNLLPHIEPTDDFNDIKTYDFINKYLPLFNIIESNFNLIVKYSNKRYIIHKNNNLINDSYEYELSNGKITKIEDITDINYDININIDDFINYKYNDIPLYYLQISDTNIFNIGNGELGF